MSTPHPSTIEEAVDRILGWPWAAEQASVDLLRGMRDDELAAMHFALGMAIRNEFGLWGQNDALMAACGASQPDEASGVILRALRDRLVAMATPEDMARAAVARLRWHVVRVRRRQAQAMKDATITDRRCDRCGMPCPRYRKTCKACGYEMGREP